MIRRRPSTPSFAKQKRICESRGWVTPKGDQLSIEGGKIRTLKDGVVVHFDHTGAWSQTGDNSDENLRPLHPIEEHKPKSREDSRSRKKLRQLTGQNKQQPKASIASRPFEKHPALKRTVGGKVVQR